MNEKNPWFDTTTLVFEERWEWVSRNLMSKARPDALIMIYIPWIYHIFIDFEH